MQDQQEKDYEKGSSDQGYGHLKWPAIILVVLIILLIFALDYCSRTGNI